MSGSNIAAEIDAEYKRKKFYENRKKKCKNNCNDCKCNKTSDEFLENMVDEFVEDMRND